jgi:type I restriction enzyme S subunit
MANQRVTLYKHTLGELLDVTRGMSLPGSNYATSGDLIRLTLGNFDYDGNGFKENTSKENIYYSGVVPEEFIMKAGDIITPLTEQTPGLLGTTARVPEDGKYIQSQDVALVTCKPGKLDPLFCYYLVSSSIVKQQLAAGSQQTKIRHTSPDKIKACVVYIPEDLDIQHRIGELLTNIDEKIMLNRKANAELEALAKQFYDYWFVQFDFPDSNGLPYKSSGGKMVYDSTIKREVPDGWEVVNLFKAASVLYGFPFSTEQFVEEVTPIPVVRIRDIPEGTHSAYSTQRVDDKYKLEKGDVVIGMDGNFHMNIWHESESFLNQRCVRIRTNDDEQALSSISLYYAIAPYIQSRQATIQGSTVGHLSDKDMKQIYVLRPSINESFNPKEIFDTIEEQIISAKNEINRLTELRNFLIPLLLNGQASIS